MIALYQNGQLYHHGTGERNCPGSGFTPKTLRDHAWKES
jgi:hypothetical protein